MLLGRQGRLDEAIAHLERVIDINPQNAEARRNLALAYRLKGEVLKADAIAAAALTSSPLPPPLPPRAPRSGC